MHWLNLPIATLNSETFIGEEPTNRATWLCLLAYCVQQENGGRIDGCRRWKDRRWQQVCRVTQAEAEAESGLWDWQGDDLIVWGYPIEKETEIKQKRAAGKIGGKAKSTRKKKAAQDNGKSGGRPRNPSTNQSETEAETQRKGKERNDGNEGPQQTHAHAADGEVMTFATKGGGTWTLTEGKLAEYWNTFPAMNVLASLRIARQWCEDNPAKRKTRTGMSRFLLSWLQRDDTDGKHRMDEAGDCWSPQYRDPTPDELAAVADIDAAEYGGAA